MVRVINTQNKPDAKLPPDQYDAICQKQADEIACRLFNLNIEFAHRPEVFEFAVYYLVMNFTTRLAKPSQEKDPELLKERFVNHLVTVFDRIHFAIP